MRALIPSGGRGVVGIAGRRRSLARRCERCPSPLGGDVRSAALQILPQYRAGRWTRGRVGCPVPRLRGSSSQRWEVPGQHWLPKARASPQHSHGTPADSWQPPVTFPQGRGVGGAQILRIRCRGSSNTVILHTKTLNGNLHYPQLYSNHNDTQCLNSNNLDYFY